MISKTRLPVALTIGVVLAVLVPTMAAVSHHSPSKDSPSQDLIAGLAVSPGHLSPNGDRCQDTATITVGFNWPSNVSDSEWTVRVDQGGFSIVFFRSGTEPVPSVSFLWDGTFHGLGDEVVDDGPYRVQAQASANDKSTKTLLSDSAQTSLVVDTVAPELTSRFPDRTGVNIEGPGGVEGSAGASVTADDQVVARFDERLSWWDSWIDVRTKAGLQVSGYSYLASSRVLVFHATTSMAGLYEAFVVASDPACNLTFEEWEFFAASR